MEERPDTAHDPEKPAVERSARGNGPSPSGGVLNDGLECALVADAIAGGRDAFQQLYRRYFRLISVMIFQKIPAAGDVEDLAQETFLHAWRGLPQLRDPARFVPWLLRIARRVVTDWRRAAARRRDEDRRLADAPADGGAPEGVIAAAEEQARMLAALRRIPDPYRIVLTMRFLEDLTPSQIANRLGEPDGTIRNRIFRALQKLERALRAEKDTRR
ncbi:MAG TPA: hypothetical protein DCM87_21640 [Planctomycetes bacterium]|jgi:RNA polymerase sigma-70 factor (ECF subfamily)|nr:hypothetical protein [Planctomycetota bacterium]